MYCIKSRNFSNIKGAKKSRYQTNIVHHELSRPQNTFEMPQKGSYAWPEMEKLIPIGRKFDG